MRTDFGEPIIGTRPRSRTEKGALLGLIVALVTSLFLNLRDNPHVALVEQLETQWIDAIRDPHHEVRVKAVNSLGQLEGRSARGLEAVGRVLEDYDPGVRREAVLAISKSGTAGKAFIPTLLRLSKDDQDREIRDMAGIAVTKLRQAPDASNLSIWLTILGTLAVLGYMTYWWLHRAAKEDPLPARRPVLSP